MHLRELKIRSADMEFLPHDFYKRSLVLIGERNQAEICRCFPRLTKLADISIRGSFQICYDRNALDLPPVYQLQFKVTIERNKITTGSFAEACSYSNNFGSFHFCAVANWETEEDDWKEFADWNVLQEAVAISRRFPCVSVTGGMNCAPEFYSKLTEMKILCTYGVNVWRDVEGIDAQKDFMFSQLRLGAVRRLELPCDLIASQEDFEFIFTAFFVSPTLISLQLCEGDTHLFLNRIREVVALWAKCDVLKQANKVVYQRASVKPDDLTEGLERRATPLEVTKTQVFLKECPSRIVKIANGEKRSALYFVAL